MYYLNKLTNKLKSVQSIYRRLKVEKLFTKLSPEDQRTLIANFIEDAGQLKVVANILVTSDIVDYNALSKEPAIMIGCRIKQVNDSQSFVFSPNTRRV